MWTKHISTISTNAVQKLGALRKAANKINKKGQATVYKGQVCSVMEYPCLAWMNASQTTLSQLDSIQRKALRIIGVNETTAAEALAINSLHHSRQVAAATTLYRIGTPAEL